MMRRWMNVREENILPPSFKSGLGCSVHPHTWGWSRIFGFESAAFCQMQRFSCFSFTLPTPPQLCCPHMAAALIQEQNKREGSSAVDWMCPALSTKGRYFPLLPLFPPGWFFLAVVPQPVFIYGVACLSGHCLRKLIRRWKFLQQ